MSKAGKAVLQEKRRECLTGRPAEAAKEDMCRGRGELGPGGGAWPEQ